MQFEPNPQRTNPCTVVPLIVVVVAIVLKIIFTFVAELVAVVTTHPAVAVEVELAKLGTARGAPAAPPPTVKPPDKSVELAAACIMRSP